MKRKIVMREKRSHTIKKWKNIKTEEAEKMADILVIIGFTGEFKIQKGSSN